MPDQQQDRKDKRLLLTGLALLGMCVGGTVVADLLETPQDSGAEESQRKSAREIAKSAVMLADAVLEIVDPEPFQTNEIKSGTAL